MKTNIGGMERVARILVGAILVGLAATDRKSVV